MKRFVLPALTLLFLQGCATQYCERHEQVYEAAVEDAPLRAPEGLQVPPADPNFAIPEATGEDVQFATAVTDADGKARSRCLDAPPPLRSAALSPPDEVSEEELESEPEPEPESEPGFETEPLSVPGESTDPAPAEF